MSKKSSRLRAARFNAAKRAKRAELARQAAEAEAKRLADIARKERIKQANTARRAEAKKRKQAGYNIKVRDSKGRIITRNVETYIKHEIMSDDRLTVQEKIIQAEVFRETVRSDYSPADGSVWARTVEAHNETETLARMFYNAGTDAETVAMLAGLNELDVSNEDNWHDGYYFDPRTGQKYEFEFDYREGSRLVLAA